MKKILVYLLLLSILVAIVKTQVRAITVVSEGEVSTSPLTQEVDVATGSAITVEETEVATGSAITVDSEGVYEEIEVEPTLTICSVEQRADYSFILYVRVENPTDYVISIETLSLQEVTQEWERVAYDSDFSTMKANTRVYGMAINGTEVEPNLSYLEITPLNLNALESTILSVHIRIPVQTQAINLYLCDIQATGYVRVQEVEEIPIEEKEGTQEVLKVEGMIIMSAKSAEQRRQEEFSVSASRNLTEVGVHTVTMDFGLDEEEVERVRLKALKEFEEQQEEKRRQEAEEEAMALFAELDSELFTMDVSALEVKEKEKEGKEKEKEKEQVQVPVPVPIQYIAQAPESVPKKQSFWRKLKIRVKNNFITRILIETIISVMILFVLYEGIYIYIGYTTQKESFDVLSCVEEGVQALPKHLTTLANGASEKLGIDNVNEAKDDENVKESSKKSK